jgi:hypothetical protein
MRMEREFVVYSVIIELLFINLWTRFWTSDEYGPYIHRFDANGIRIQSIQPPAAILPYINGKLNFTSSTDPTTGRAGNQGSYLHTHRALFAS